jgi:hypothetical protein
MRPTDATRRLAILLGCVTAILWGSFFSGVSVRGTEQESTTADSDRGRADHFATKIAPLLARHCLECHDSQSEAGDLDLTRKAAAFAGGENGPAIKPGSSAESLLWQYVESDEMPKNRAALSSAEKTLLRDWIDAGADWSVEVIDPEKYLHNTQGSEIWLQRLTVREYIQTVRDTVGVDIAEEASRLLPRDQRADGFTNTAYNLSVDLSHVEAYDRLARVIVSRMDVNAFAARYADCKQLNEKCLNQVIRGMGKQLLRGPLRDEEVAAFLEISKAVQEAGGDFPEAVSYILRAMLQSPRFLFRLERQRGDGGSQLVGDYELASRISYILWGAPPDEELMRLADEGKLNDPERIEAQVERMLKDPRAVDRSLQFVSEWLNLDRLDQLQPNPQRFPQWNSQLAADMRMETEKFFEDLVWEQDRPLWELLNAQFTYATPRLAAHYGLIGGKQATAASSETVSRVREGLQTLYTFEEETGDTVRDGSGNKEPLDLRITDPGGVRWGRHGLDIHGTTLISSEKTPARLIGALKKSNALTLEAWVTPAAARQSGPARIVTLSHGISARNFTLGQENDTFETRLRTTKTSGNGIPALASASGTAVAAPLHVVYTRDAAGNARIHVNGQEAGKSKIEGDFSNWDDRLHLALGNELSRDRLWRGTLHLVAIYDRALSQSELRQNHAAGAGALEADLGPNEVAAAWEQSDQAGLVALYRFDEGAGGTVRNHARGDKSLDLTIEDPSRVKWGPGGLTVYDSTLVGTQKPPKRLIDSIKKSREFSLEAWVTPANSQQDGPARIVSLSSGSGERNFTLGQDGSRFDLRIRSGKTDRNGLPSLSSPSGSALPQLAHVVFTADSSGQARLYVNGVVQDSRDIGGRFDAWSDQYRLFLANESSRDRPWRGTVHLVAMYDRVLSPEEIESRKGGIKRYDLADHPARGGLLTQGSVLTIGGDHASMVTRGLFVMHDLLDGRVGNPPASVDTTPVPTKPGLSMRKSAEIRLADNACSGCHAKFEPLAFGLEKFDGIGGYHEIDHHGNQLREDGEIRLPGSAQPVSYQTSAELMELLAGSDRVRLVITRKLLQFSLGRPLNADDLEQAPRIHDETLKRGGTYRAAMTAILTSDLIRKTRTEAN